MKKIYISPEVKVVKLTMTHIICQSPQTFYEENGKSGVVLSRRADVWDDEEEDDF